MLDARIPMDAIGCNVAIAACRLAELNRQFDFGISGERNNTSMFVGFSVKTGAGKHTKVIFARGDNKGFWAPR